MLLTQQQARPDLPNLGKLPGASWPGIHDYIKLMQVSQLVQLLFNSMVGSEFACCIMLLLSLL